MHGDAMVARKNGGTGALNQRPRAALPAGEKHRQLFQPPQRPRGFGQLGLPHPRVGLRMGVSVPQVGERRFERPNGNKGGHSAIHPGGGMRVRKCPLTPSGHSA